MLFGIGHRFCVYSELLRVGRHYVRSPAMLRLTCLVGDSWLAAGKAMEPK